jgi:tetratricopeptide (TPR) repeat protein
LAEAALGNGHRARALGQEACRILDRSGDIPGHHGALNNLAIVEILSGHPAQAIDALERALALGIPDTHRSVGWQYRLLAGLRQRSGNQAAASALTAARECFQRIGERRGLDAVVGLDRGGTAGSGPQARDETK